MEGVDQKHHAQASELFAAIGSFIMAWGQLETRLSWSFHELAPEAADPLIDPDNISRTLKRLLKSWRRAFSDKAWPNMQTVDALRDMILAHADHRNAICHGSDGMWTNLRKTDASLGCWSRYHESRMTASAPEQIFYTTSHIRTMTTELGLISRQVYDLTEAALHAQES
jgi:hypothetical protein